MGIEYDQLQNQLKVEKNFPFFLWGELMPTFEFVRLSLSVPTIGDLIAEENRREPDISRTEFLSSVFSERIDFFYSGRLYTFMPSPEDAQGPNLYSGYIGKPVTEFVNAGPEELFALTRSEHYRASFVAFDVSPDQQLVAFEKRQDVGSPIRILTALFDEYKKKNGKVLWHVDAEYLSYSESFWQAARENKGRITQIIFEFYPPNGLKGFDKFKEFDRIAKQQANGHSSEYSIKNEDGAINPGGEFVESAVEYASEGPGKIVMKEGRKTIYNSRQAKRTKDAPEVLMPRQGEASKILGLIAWLFGKKNG